MKFKRLISSILIAVTVFGFLGTSALAEEKFKVLLSLNGEAGTSDGQAYTPRAPWSIANATAGNSVQYSSAGAYSGDYGMKVTTVSSNYRLEGKTTESLDANKFYRIQFFAKAEGENSFNFALYSKVGTTYPSIKAVTLSGSSWTKYTYYIGSGGVPGVDIPFINNIINSSELLYRFYASGGIFYIDDFIVEEVDIENLIKEASFESPVPGDNSAAFSDLLNNWELNGEAYYSSEAKSSGEYGVKLSGEAKYKLNGFNPQNKYKISLTGNTDGDFYFVDLVNENGLSILTYNEYFENGLKIYEPADYEMVIGDLSDKDVEVTINRDNILSEVYLKIYGSGQLFFDDICVKSVADTGIAFSVESMDFQYTDAEGDPKILLTGGKTVKTSFDYKNTTLYAVNLEFLVCGYKNGMFDKVVSTKYPALPRTADTVSLDFLLPDDTEAYTLKAFLWDDMDTQSPVILAQEIPGSISVSQLDFVDIKTGSLTALEGPLATGEEVQLKLESSKGEGSVITVVTRDEDENIVYINEFLTDENGIKLCSMKFSQEAENKDCVIYASGHDIAMEEYEIYNLTSDGINSVMSLMNSRQYEDALTDEMNKKILKTIGIDIDLYFSLSESAKLKVKENLTAGKPETGYIQESLKNLFNKYSAFESINDKKSASQNSFFEEVTKYSQYLTETTGNSWVLGVLYNDNPFDNFEDMSVRIKNLKSLNEINICDYVAMPDKLKDNADILELSGNSTILGYINSTNNSYKDSISKAVVSSARSNPFTNNQALKDAIVKAINTSAYNPGSGGQGGGATGGGGSGISTTTPTAPVLKELNPAGDSNETAIYEDLNGYEWAEQSILLLTEIEVVNGSGENKFNPANSITREEFVKMLMTAIGNADFGEAVDFSDVDAGRWSYPYVKSAKNAGIVNGIDENTFGAGNNITRADMAAMIFRAVKFIGKDIAELDSSEFLDWDDVPEYSKIAVGSLNFAGIVTGSDGCFKPNDNASRAEAAVIIARVYTSIIGKK